MTFYNVLSALLFIGGLRVLLISFENANWQNIFASGCLAVIIFNDMLSTSHQVESKKEIEYSGWLMLIDLANFLLLAFALVIISPTQNFFDVPLPNVALNFGSSTFWLFLLLYWLLLMTWTSVSRQKTGGQKRPLVLGQLTVAVVFLTRWLLSLWQTTDLVMTFSNAMAFAYLLIYLIAIRPILRAKYPTTA